MPAATQAGVFVGVDVASRKLDACFVDLDGNPLRPPLCVPNNLVGFDQLREAIGSVAAERHVIVGCESTGAYHKPLLRAVDGHFPVVELNPITIKRFTELQLRGSRSDRTDANSIAQYLRTFRPSPTKLQERHRRDLSMAVRMRRNTIEERTAKKNAFRRYLGELAPGFHVRFQRKTPLWLVALVAAHPSPDQLLALTADALQGIRTPGGARIRLEQLDALRALLREAAEDSWSLVVQHAIGSLARDLVEAARQIAEFDRLIEASIEEHEEARLLLTIKGVGPLTAATVLAEVGDIHRFPDVDHFIGYCGLYPASKRSGDGSMVWSMVRKGNRHLRLQLLLASTTARRHNPAIRDFYERLIANGKTKKCAGGAAGRKLATQVFAILRSGTPFDPSKP